MFKIDLNVPRDEQVVLVNTTEKRGLSPEELSEQCVQKIVSVSDQRPSWYRDQARAFSKHVESLLRIICDRLFAVTVQQCVMH